MKKSLTFLSVVLLATSALAQNPSTPLPSVPNSMPKPNVAAAPSKDTATPSTPTPRVGEIKSPTAPSTSAAPSTSSTPQTAGSARTADQNQQKAAPGQDSSRNEPPQQSSSNQLNGTQKSQNMFPSPNLPLQQQGGPTAQPLQQNRGAQSTQSQSLPSASRASANTAPSGNASRSSASPNSSAGQGSAAGQSSAAGQNRADSASRLDNRGEQSESRSVMQREDSNATDRNSATDRNGRERTAFRPNDLRAPDLGLWFDRSARDGLVISDIATRGAIANLGFHEGDRLVSVNGHRVAREADFIQYLLGSDLTGDAAVAAQPMPVVISRDGQEQTIQVEPSLLLADYGYAAPVDPLEQFGLVLDDRTPNQIVVWRVLPRSPAYYAGFRSGDVLTTFHDQPIRSAEEFQQTLSASNPGEVGVQVRRGERTRDLQVDMPRLERQSERRTAMRPNLNTGSSEATNSSGGEKRTQQEEKQSDQPSTPRLDPFRANR